MIYAKCHTDKKHYGRGLCKRCLQKEWEIKHPDYWRSKDERYKLRRDGTLQPYLKTDKLATCHSDRKHFAKGLCSICYSSQRWQKMDEDKRAKALTYRKQWLEDNHEKRRWYWLKARTGITKEQYLNLMETQKGLCPICERALAGTLKPHVDHDHETGKIRGILCELCNKGLGQFKDNLSYLESAFKYLAKNK